MMIDDQLPGGRPIQRFRQRPRRQIRIERHHRQPRGLEKQRGHQRRREKCPLSVEEHRADGAEEQRDRRNEQRRSQVRERLDREIAHVSQR